MIKQHTLLAIDTSTATMAGAILQQDQLLVKVQTEAERNHSIHIMTNIEHMLTEAKLSVHDVTAFITGIGPGSYTGVRIAVTAAKTLAWSSGKPVIGVSSLEGLAYGALLQEQEQLHQGSVVIIPLMDARRGQVYTAAFQASGTGKWERQHNDHIQLMNNWSQSIQEQLQSYAQNGITELWFVGDVNLHEEAIELVKVNANEQSITVRSLTSVMQGLAIAKLGEAKLSTMSEDELAEVHDLVPNYAQLTEAEVKQNAKEKEEGQV
ncbi:tRNA (adenosine(37)-N6)-threonylcarbamoyltransferase complex dimerization subunit type 1 TsaB [Paenibacillus endoradicis]|uniref:tRNA (adenosine(37)-N6)-threonylcarbamoyltransferase complex dimerization subunit type 1 TsaB n=1 Tax=Paenibacillus endoradicis TaxID=2972487 RepID=UPI00215948B2|nr:tRNA (adenosine(37)-N6)-threonylcarbamoyltransferase complex dimerization subunit type 1 TsaB [Paenibacillus endoradicis]MCR8657298.1 tRNA (adenosine(37)-N6)-threonylcarbamoyltransferase complex dimerization subunit type 1 TsaB [Paenibacillus endoradicis]